jgi:hypothetical protein
VLLSYGTSLSAVHRPRRLGWSRAHDKIIGSLGAFWR